MRAAVKYNRFRMNFLLEQWRKAVKEYSDELSFSKNEVHRKLLEKLQTLDETLISRFLKLWHERCKYKFALCFL